MKTTAEHDKNTARPVPGTIGKVARHRRALRAGAILLACLPGLLLLLPVLAGTRDYRFVLDPTGEIAAVLLVAVLSISPLKTLFPKSAPLAWAARERRWLGLATFFYAAFHMVFFVLAIGSVGDMIIGLAWASMWTGWSAFLLLGVVAAVSSGTMHRLLGRVWKPIQRLAYFAAVLALAHWLLLAANAWAALVCAALLALLEAARIASNLRSRRRSAFAR